MPLTMNFRSVPALCDWANTVFAGQFPAEPTVHSPQFAPTGPEGGRRQGELEEPVGPLHPDARRRCQRGGGSSTPSAIARYIRSEVDAGRRKYSDFLILTRKKKARIAPYASALEELNIPLEVSGAGAFGESAEVEALTVLLRALADPQDQLTLVNVLRGPLFGLSDRELFDVQAVRGLVQHLPVRSRHHPIAARRRSAPRNDSVVRVALLRRCAVSTAGRACSRPAPRWTRSSSTPATSRSPRRRRAESRRATCCMPSIVSARCVEDGGNLADAADALEADSEASNEVESLPLEPGRTDVVRLMNLHKAKGLEADVVFLADPAAA